MKSSQLQIEEPQLFSQDDPRLLQVFSVVQDPGGKRFSVFGDPLSVKEADLLPQVVSVACGCRKRERRLGRIDVNWRNIKLEIRTDLLQVDPANAGDALQPRNKGELQLDPITPIPLVKHYLLVLDHDFRHRLGRIEPNRKVDECQRGAFPERIGRAEQLGGNSIVLRLHRVDATAASLACLLQRVAGVEGENSVGALHVGRAHACQGSFPRFDRREIHRHMNHRGGNFMFVKDLPEGLSMPE